jgi:hypothetical protein
MPVKDGIPAKSIKGKTSVQNPRDFKNAQGVARFNPAPRSGGGPATRKAGHRVGDAPVPGVARMTPTAPTGGGPATRKPGHRVGKVNDVNPQKRFHPLSG